MSSDLRQTIISWSYFPVILVTAVLFARWVHLASRNAHHLTGGDLRHTPGWAVGWYFVPVATYWKPYQAMREIFRASNPDASDEWRTAPRPNLLPMWWTLWVLSNLLTMGLLSSSFSAETVEELLSVTQRFLLSDALDLPLTLCTLAVVARLQTWQDQKREALGGSGAQDTQAPPRIHERQLPGGVIGTGTLLTFWGGSAILAVASAILAGASALPLVGPASLSGTSAGWVVNLLLILLGIGLLRGHRLAVPGTVVVAIGVVTAVVGINLSELDDAFFLAFTVMTAAPFLAMVIYVLRPGIRRVFRDPDFVWSPKPETPARLQTRQPDTPSDFDDLEIEDRPLD